nr:protein phosphatase 1 regulatory subunit 14C-like isoform X1 [Cherax quadricarinatus]
MMLLSLTRCIYPVQCVLKVAGGVCVCVYGGARTQRCLLAAKQNVRSPVLAVSVKGTDVRWINLLSPQRFLLFLAHSGMEVGVASYTSGRTVGSSPDRGRGPPRGNLHVEFAQIGEVKERKEKYLTAKYGAHQMSLIRKRLGVEMWMFDQLQTLYPSPEGKNEEKELDLDELLDVEGELKRKKYLWDSLADCKQSKDKVEKFIAELLERATTL